MSIPKFSTEKDPTDDCDWRVDWAGVEPLSAGDTIASFDSVDIVPITDPVLAESTAQRSNTDTTTTIWLTGGKAGTTYTLTQTVTTAGGRTFQRSAKLKVKDL